MEDRLLFSESSTGKYLIAKYIKTTRMTAPKVVWDGYIRNKFTSYRVNAFIWRVSQNALPVDRNNVGIASAKETQQSNFKILLGLHLT